MKGDAFKMFDCLPKSYYNKLFSQLDIVYTVVDVWDQHVECSVKEVEHVRRGNQGKQNQVMPGRVVPPWHKFPSNPENKVTLANFIGEYIKEHSPTCHLLQDPDKVVYVAGALLHGCITCTMSVTSNLVQNEDSYMCSQEDQKWCQDEDCDLDHARKLVSKQEKLYKK